MSEVILLSNVRLSFPHIAEPQRRVNEQTGKERVSYNCDLIMPADHPGFIQFMKRYGELAVDKWKEHASNVMQIIQSDRKSRCFGKGDEKVNKKTFEPYDGYVNNVFISASKDVPPQIIQPDGTPVDPNNTLAYQQLTRALYGGCRVNVAIKPWVQNNDYGRGIRCDLLAIQFAGDDLPFGEGKLDASSMFTPVESMPVSPFPEVPGLPSFITGK